MTGLEVVTPELEVVTPQILVVEGRSTDTKAIKKIFESLDATPEYVTTPNEAFQRIEEDPILTGLITSGGSKTWQDIVDAYRRRAQDELAPAVLVTTSRLVGETALNKNVQLYQKKALTDPIMSQSVLDAWSALFSIRKITKPKK